jgi:hypothetical protein
MTFKDNYNGASYAQSHTLSLDIHRHIRDKLIIPKSSLDLIAGIWYIGSV